MATFVLVFSLACVFLHGCAGRGSDEGNLTIGGEYSQTFTSKGTVVSYDSQVGYITIDVTSGANKDEKVTVGYTHQSDIPEELAVGSYVEAIYIQGKREDGSHSGTALYLANREDNMTDEEYYRSLTSEGTVTSSDFQHGRLTIDVVSGDKEGESVTIDYSSNLELMRGVEEGDRVNVGYIQGMNYDGSHPGNMLRLEE